MLRVTWSTPRSCSLRLLVALLAPGERAGDKACSNGSGAGADSDEDELKDIERGHGSVADVSQRG